MRQEPDYRRDKGILPPYAGARDCVLEALPALGPAQRMTVPAAAAKFRRVEDIAYRGPWINESAPYMIEPAEVMTSRQFEGEVFVGPARTLKTDALVVNTIVHRVMCQPRNMSIIHMSQGSAREFSIETVDKLIRTSPEIRARLGKERGDDNIYDKRFAGGMRLSIGWPVIDHVSAKTIPDVLLTDYDRMPENINGEGDLFFLAKKRNENAGSLGKTMAESSPGRPILREDWVPSTPHEPPPTTGILNLYGQGTRGRLYWPCAQCEVPYEPHFNLFDYPKNVSPVEAGERAVLVCPHCGYPTPHDVKTELLAYSFWLHETAEAKTVVIDGKKTRIGLTRLDGNVRPATFASHWMFGPAAKFQTWPKLVSSFLQALESYERTGDEQALKTTTNVDHGDAYRPRSMAASSLMTEEEIKKRSISLDGKLVPAGTRFITMQVDVQSNRFVVQVDAWGVGLERWLVDRFELFIPAAAHGVERALDPARYPKDWDLLFGLIERTYEVEGTGYALKPAFIVSDSAGAPGVTLNAYAFWRRARKKGLGERIMLVRGNHVKKGLAEDQRRAYVGFPERSTENGKTTQLDVPLIWAGTDALKDEISAALTRDELGEGSYRVLKRVDERVFAELSAERRTENRWEKRQGVVRNEALDLAVYGKAVAIIKGAEKIDWKEPVNWAAPMASNVYAVRIEGAAPPLVPIEIETATPPEVVAAPSSGRRSNWLGGRRKGYLGK